MPGFPAARQFDMTAMGGPIVQGSLGVMIGAPTGVACSVCPGGVKVGSPVNPSLGAKVLPDETDIALPAPSTRGQKTATARWQKSSKKTRAAFSRRMSMSALT